MDNATQSRGRGKPPVSAHPAFPAVVALWFAALLGIGSLILPVRLYETILTATGISSMVSAAAPPLGFTARALIALVATVMGAGLGLYAARRLSGAANGFGFSRSKREETSHRAFSASEEIDEDGIDDEDDDLPPMREPVVPAGRRRALAMAEEEGPSELLNAVPLPGEDALELSDEAPEQRAQEKPAPSMPVLDYSAPEEVYEPSYRPDFSAPQDEDEGVEPLELEDEAEDEAEASAQASALPEPLPFSPPSLARKGEAAEEDTKPAEPAQDSPTPGFLNRASPRLFDTPKASAATPQADMADSASTPDFSQNSSPNSSEDIVSDKPFTPSDAHAELESTGEFDAPQAPVEQEAKDEAGEGLVQLVQKLGSTLEKHREWSAKRAAEGLRAGAAMPAPAPQMFDSAADDAAEDKLAEEFDPAAADDAAEAMAAYFGKPAAATTDEVAAEEDGLPEDPRPFAAPKQVFQPVENADGGSDDGVDPEHPAPPAPAPGEAYAPFNGFAASANRSMAGDDAEDDEDSVDDLAASFKLPIAAKTAPAEDEPAPVSARPAFDIPPPSARTEAKPESNRDADYSAVAANNPFKANAEDFVRIDEPEPDTAEPAVVFPNQQRRAGSLGLTPAPAGGEQSTSASSASNDDNERALREALMNLQRMGK